MASGNLLREAVGVLLSGVDLQLGGMSQVKRGRSILDGALYLRESLRTPDWIDGPCKDALRPRPEADGIL